MGKLIDETGHVYGQLTVLRRVENDGQRVAWLCRCTCGEEFVVRGQDLRDGNTWRCRTCFARSMRRKFSSRSPERIAWRNALERCTNPANPEYPNYGGRGVKVCAEWAAGEEGFQHFLAHVGPRPHPRWSLDRIDVDGDYVPGNVRWADVRTQALNRRSTKFLEHTDPATGETTCRALVQWTEALGLGRGVVADRLRRGLGPTAALRRGFVKFTEAAPEPRRTWADFEDQVVRRVDGGEVFGQLTVVAELRPLACGHPRVLCRCTCGNLLAVHTQQLTEGYTVGCGCAPVVTVNKDRLRVDALAKARRAWINLRQRCTNVNNPRFMEGVVVADRWADLEQFLADLGTPTEGSRLVCADGARVLGPSTVRWSDGPPLWSTDEERPRRGSGVRRAWNFRDLSGRTYGRLTVIEPLDELDHGHVVYRCRCACGAEDVRVKAQDLTRGRVQSCGCLRTETVKERSTTHGLSRSRERTVFDNMHKRCENPGHNRFASYGGRGIRVCGRWSGPDGFEHFLEDMGPQPTGMSLDRVDVDGDYGPGNCRWASVEVQANNRSTSARLTVNGETHTYAEWGHLRGLRRGVVADRLRSGLTPEEAVTPGDLRARRVGLPVLTRMTRPAAYAGFADRLVADRTQGGRTRVGQVHGGWVVVNRLTPSEGGQTCWLLRCPVCGRVRAVVDHGLVKGGVKPCRHRDAEDACVRVDGPVDLVDPAEHPLVADLTGLAFGRLTVVGLAGATPVGRQAAWLCTCTCGGRALVAADALASGRVADCGCGHRPWLKGRRFGALTAVNPLGDGRWACRCTCGRSVVAEDAALLDGSAVVCGERFCPGVPADRTGAEWARVGGGRWPSVDALVADLGRCPVGGRLVRLDEGAPWSTLNARWAVSGK